MVLISQGTILMNSYCYRILGAIVGIVVALSFPSLVIAQGFEPSESGSIPTATDEIMQQIDPNFSLDSAQSENGGQDEQADESASESGKSGFARFLADEVGLILILGAGSAVWVVMLIDALKRPSRTFPGTGTKTVWEVGILVTWLIGALVYYFVVYRKNQPKMVRKHLMET